MLNFNIIVLAQVFVFYSLEMESQKHWRVFCSTLLFNVRNKIFLLLINWLGKVVHLMRLWKVVHLIISCRQESGGFFWFFFANVNFMNGLFYVLIIQSRKQRDSFKNFIIIFFPKMGFYYLLAAYQKQTSPRGFGLNHSFVAMKC